MTERTSLPKSTRTEASRDDSRRAMLSALLSGVGVAALAGCTIQAGEEAAPKELVEEVEQALVGSNIVWVDTMTSLRALVGGPGSTPQLAILAGYWQPADGGGGLFVWKSGAVTDNGGTVFSGSAAGGWLRIYDGAISVKWFGAVGDGAAIDLLSFTLAVAALPAVGGELVIPAGTYHFGKVKTGTKLLDLTNKASCRVTGHNAELTCETTDTSMPAFFFVRNPNNITFRGLRFRDIGTDLNQDWRGAICFLIRTSIGGGSNGFCGGVTIQECHAEKVVVFLSVDAVNDNSTASVRVTDILVERCKVKASYYGISCIDNGDSLRAIAFECEDVRRAYFVYGVSDHEADVTVHDTTAPLLIGNPQIVSTGSIVINRFIRSTKGIRVRATFHGVARHQNAVHITDAPQVSGSAGIIEDVDVELRLLDLTSPASMTPVRFTAYSQSGGVPLATTTAARWDKIRISGNFGPVGAGVVIDTTQGVEGTLFIDPRLTRSLAPFRPSFPGFVLKTGWTEEVRTLVGNLTAGNIVLPLSAWNTLPFTLRIVIYVCDGQLAFQNSVHREDIVVGYNAGGGGVGLLSVTTVVQVVTGVAPTITYTPSGEDLVVAFSGAPYTGALSYARVVVDTGGNLL